MSETGPLGSDLSGLATSGKRLFVGDYGEDDSDGRGLIHQVDPATGEAVGRSIPAREPFEIASEGSSLWVLSDTGTVERIDLRSRDRTRVDFDGAAFDVAVSGGTAWVVDNDSGELHGFDARTGEPRGRPVDVGTAADQRGRGRRQRMGGHGPGPARPGAPGRRTPAVACGRRRGPAICRGRRRGRLGRRPERQGGARRSRQPQAARRAAAGRRSPEHGGGRRRDLGAARAVARRQHRRPRAAAGGAAVASGSGARRRPERSRCAGPSARRLGRESSASVRRRVPTRGGRAAGAGRGSAPRGRARRA